MAKDCLVCDTPLTFGTIHGRGWVASYSYCDKCDVFPEFKSYGLSEQRRKEMQVFLRYTFANTDVGKDD